MGAALYMEEGFSEKEAGGETCLGEAEKHTLTTWKGGIQKEHRPRWVWVLDPPHRDGSNTGLRWVFSCPFSYPFHLQRLEILKKKKKFPESLAAMILKTN